MSYRIKCLSILTGLFVISVTGCRGVMLDERIDEVEIDPQGVYFQKDDAIISVLWISQASDSRFPYSYLIKSFRFQEKIFSGRRLIMTVRSGVIETSKHQLLFIQDSFERIRIDNDGNSPGSVWDSSKFEREQLERRLIKSSSWNVFDVENGGALLAGGDMNFRRIASSRSQPELDRSGAILISEKERAIGVVLKSDYMKPDNIFTQDGNVEGRALSCITDMCTLILEKGELFREGEALTGKITGKR